MGCCVSSNTPVVMPEEESPTTSPVRKRKCTDVFFLLVFVSSLIAAGYVVGEYAFVFGDPGRYINGVDSWGNVCGRKENQKILKASSVNGSLVKNTGLDRSSHTYELNFALSDFRNLAEAAIGNANSSAALCVQSCPNVSTNCADLVRANGYDVDTDILSRRICHMPGGIVVSHQAILNRCIPEQFVALGKGVDQALVAAVGIFSANTASNSTNSNTNTGAAGIARDMIQSISQNYITLTYLLLIAVGASLLMIILLQLVARVLVVMVMVLAAFGTGAATGWLWYSYAVSEGIIPATSAMDVWVNLISSGQEALGIRSNVSSATADLSGILSLQKLNQSRFLLPIAIGATVFTLICWILLTWTRKSLWLTVRLFDEASVAVFSNPSMLLQPFHTTIWLAVSAIGFLIGTSYLLSDQVPLADGDGLVTFVERPFIESGRIRFIFFLFVFLWMFEFTFGCHEVILAGVVSSWYFDNSKGDKKCNVKWFSVFKPMLQLLRYNLGTVALGSLIVAIVQFIRIVLLYLQRKLKNSDNKTAKFILKCLQCCLTCFEKVLKYINRNAYICVAMYGEGFCASARRALGLLVSNAQHVLTLNCVSGLCILLGKISVVAAVAAVGWIWIPGTDVSDVKFFFPLIICSVGAFFISSCFLSVFVIAIDTIFLCFCDDMQRNNGDDRPYYSSKRLQSIMSGGNKKAKQQSNHSCDEKV